MSAQRVSLEPHHQQLPFLEESPRASGDQKTIFITGRCGRLGNRITLFANFIGFAEEHGYRLINFTFHSYAHLFETTRRDIFCQYPVPAHRSWVDVVPGLAPLLRKTRICAHVIRHATLLHERFPIFGSATIMLREPLGNLITPLDDLEVQDRIRHARTVLVMGWTFRAGAYVQRHAEKIRAYFRPVEQHAQASRRIVDHLRQNANVVVGVHIRQGDYGIWRGGKYLFPIARYAAWMHELAGQFPGAKVSFLITSNEPRSASEFPGLLVGFSSGVPVEDIHALAECDYVLGPVSSFSQWASFYGNKPLFHLTSLDAHVERDQFRVSYLGEVPH